MWPHFRTIEVDGLFLVVDKGIVISRSSDDRGAFVPKIIEEIREGRHQQHKAA